jgi:hypothetical protein
MRIVGSSIALPLSAFSLAWQAHRQTPVAAQRQTCYPNTLHVSDKVQHRSSRRVTIAHRGASFDLPQHTSPAYRLALELGADYVEPDLVASADGQLVALHSVDLEVTTNVVEEFGLRRSPWFSPWANRTGYWSFNFTAAELVQLTVRQYLPDARSTAYDGLWTVPTLDDIVHVVKDWNLHVLPQLVAVQDSDKGGDENEPDPIDSSHRRPTAWQLAQAGIYAELKDSVWLRQEAGLDLGALLMQHLHDHIDDWSTLMPCYDEVLFDQYKVPGLVVQAFEAPALEAWQIAWGNSPTLPGQLPAPPLVLLMDNQQCQDENFWFDVLENYRDVIAGIGCDKSCLLGERAYSLTSTKADEFGLAIHAWSLRPEGVYVDKGFADLTDELHYLYCHVNIQGVFSEDVAGAVRVAAMGCDERKHKDKYPNHGSSSDDEENSEPYCYDSANEAGFFTSVAAFVMGAFTTSLFFLYYGRHAQRWQSSVVPSADADTSRGLEMT